VKIKTTIPGARVIHALVCASALVCGAGAARGQGTTVTLDPAKTKVQFTLGATAHTVHGSFHLLRGQIHFDVTIGKAGGEIVVDARSGDTDNSGRDKKMHEEVLQTEKYTEIVFSPSRVQGVLPQRGRSQMQVTGTMRLLGQEHPMTLAFIVETSEGNGVEVSTAFEVPYVEWGLKNPSSFLLRVDKTVHVEVHAAGEWRTVVSGH
jgi:polyisoprenoid-binding protein YceI